MREFNPLSQPHLSDVTHLHDVLPLFLELLLQGFPKEDFACPERIEITAALSGLAVQDDSAELLRGCAPRNRTLQEASVSEEKT